CAKALCFFDCGAGGCEGAAAAECADSGSAAAGDRGWAGGVEGVDCGGAGAGEADAESGAGWGVLRGAGARLAMLIWLGIATWAIALFWTSMIAVALWKLPSVPDVLDAKYEKRFSEPPLISVIVPARNEAADIEATLRSLLAVEGVRLEIIAVDDRSNDATGAIMDRVAAEAANVAVVHVAELPGGWLGKP